MFLSPEVYQILFSSLIFVLWQTQSEFNRLELTRGKKLEIVLLQHNLIKFLNFPCWYMLVIWPLVRALNVQKVHEIKSTYLPRQSILFKLSCVRSKLTNYLYWLNPSDHTNKKQFSFQLTLLENMLIHWLLPMPNLRTPWLQRYRFSFLFNSLLIFSLCSFVFFSNFIS